VEKGLCNRRASVPVPSVSLSVPLGRRTPLLRVCCCGPGGQEISVDCCTAGGQQQPRRSSGCGQRHLFLKRTCCVRYATQLLISVFIITTIIIIDIFKVTQTVKKNYCKDHCSGGEIMTRKGKCHSESNSFVAAAEQVRLQPVLEHRQRRGRRNIAWQAIPHHCSNTRKGTTSDS